MDFFLQKQEFFTRFVSMKMVAILDFKALSKVHIILEPLVHQMQKKGTHEETYTSVFSFVE